MPTIDDYYSGGSSLKAVDIDGDEMDVVIAGWRDHTFADGKKTLFLKLQDMDKEFRVNYTNGGRIATMYGKEVEDWIGKTLTLMPDKTKDPKGNLVDTIIVRLRRTTPSQRAAKPKYDETNPPPPLDDEVPFMREDRA